MQICLEVRLCPFRTHLLLQYFALAHPRGDAEKHLQQPYAKPGPGARKDGYFLEESGVEQVSDENCRRFAERDVQARHAAPPVRAIHHVVVGK